MRDREKDRPAARAVLPRSGMSSPARFTPTPITKRAVVVGACALLACTGVGASGCSSESDSKGECLGESAAALRTCAKGPTLTGIDVSYYQGTVNWTSVKSSGRAFAFARVSDGLNFPDSKFAANWPAMKTAGIIRGAYQFFRPAQDPTQQADMMLAKIDAAGGLQPGDLPPVLDLESDGGLAPATVVARAKTWLARVQAKTGVKPIVYTANFMSNVIGTSFGSYTLWVANYGATCPLMPSGWTDWQFWQTADNGSVTGVTGNVDTNLFNGNLAALQALTLKPASVTDAGSGDGGVDPGGDDNPKPKDGSQGATIGDTNPPKDTNGAPLDPCAPK
jgi:lysozyme